jgi:lipopolysaccharide transport system ATP-binding protein
MSNDDVVIRVENLGKRYKLGLVHHDRLADAITAGIHWVGRGLRRLFPRNGHALMASSTSPLAPRPSALVGRQAPDDIWALRNVSFEVKRGQVVGIIGRNGAGKSTLLKILTGITEPTEGRAWIKGRVASLLEVGTGFHPELTGRENIFFNGAILGMSRAETRRKLDEIVAFAEIERFIDTPVKRYSSGMYVRLAFAVAAHLEPQILIVDEVLAVGDVQFQRKCLGKMEQVATGEGRTILLVSHNIASVEALCHRGLLLADGRVQCDDVANNAVSLYLTMLTGVSHQNVASRKDRRGAGNVRIVGIDVTSGDDLPAGMLATGRAARFRFMLDRTIPGASCQFTVYDETGHGLAFFDSTSHCPTDSVDPRLQRQFICDLDEFLLSPGRYRLNVRLMRGAAIEDHVEAATVVEVVQGTVRGRPVISSAGHGRVCMAHRWTLSQA